MRKADFRLVPRVVRSCRVTACAKIGCLLVLVLVLRPHTFHAVSRISEVNISVAQSDLPACATRLLLLGSTQQGWLPGVACHRVEVVSSHSLSLLVA